MDTVDVLWSMSVILLALSAGMAFTHVLEIPGKNRLPHEAVVAIQQRLYVGYRYAGTAIEALQLAGLATAAVLSLGEGGRFWLTVAALAADLATAVVFVAVTDRQNRWMAGVSVDAPPTAGWRRARAHWERSHGARAALFTVALALLLVALATS